jgi:hypothetical protein
MCSYFLGPPSLIVVKGLKGAARCPKKVAKALRAALKSAGATFSIKLAFAFVACLIAAQVFLDFSYLSL